MRFPCQFCKLYLTHASSIAYTVFTPSNIAAILRSEAMELCSHGECKLDKTSLHIIPKWIEKLLESPA